MGQKVKTFRKKKKRKVMTRYTNHARAFGRERAAFAQLCKRD